MRIFRSGSDPIKSVHIFLLGLPLHYREKKATNYWTEKSKFVKAGERREHSNRVAAINCIYLFLWINECVTPLTQDLSPFHSQFTPSSMLYLNPVMMAIVYVRHTQRIVSMHVLFELLHFQFTYLRMAVRRTLRFYAFRAYRMQWLMLLYCKRPKHENKWRRKEIASSPILARIIFTFFFSVLVIHNLMYSVCCDDL